MNEFLGLYPAWLEPGIGAGWVIGFIATIHVLFSHASVGAALVFAWLARRAVTANQPQHLDFIRKYGAFLLIFSYVLGSVTGPGIWFAATIANPRGISALIHNFVWLWATEWVFFLIEVAGVYLLVYLAGRVPIKTYLRYCTIFALSSVGTLLIIVGILSFMLWPGQDSWYQTGGVLSAFFGESMFAQLSARFFFMLTITGVVGGFALPDLRGEYLLPTGTWDQALLACGLSLLPSGVFFLPCRRRRPGGCWPWTLLIPLSAAALAAVTAGILSPELAAIPPTPLYLAAQSVSLFGVMEHIEPLLSAAMTMGIFCLMASLTCAVQALADQLRPWKWSGALACLAAAAVMGPVGRLPLELVALGAAVFFGLTPLLCTLRRS